MANYVFEVVRGEDKLYLTSQSHPEDTFEEPKKRIALDLKLRNALFVTDKKKALALLDAIIGIKPKSMRRLLRVDKSYELPVRVFVRRLVEDGLNNPATAQRTYYFKEPAA